MPVQVVVTDDEQNTAVVIDDPSIESVVEIQVPGPQGAPGSGGGAEYPAGGATGQVLSKASGADNDVHWSDPVAGADGTDGADGASAYQVAVANGFVGDQAAWLASLHGADGTDGTNGTNGTDGSDGADGLSAYQIAVNNGFVGTEAAWLASLQGADGTDGTNGTNGTNGTDGETHEVYIFSVGGTLTVQQGKSRVYMEDNFQVLTVRAAVNTQPTGAAVIVDVNKNGTTIFTTQSKRPQIAVSTNSDLSDVPDVTTFAAGDYMTVDVDQIGSTVAGADLTVTVRVKKV